MHPVILWGYRRRGAVVGQLSYDCPRCHQNVPHTVVKTQTKFTLFFIPLFPIGTSYKAVCANCKYEEKVTKQQAQKMFPAQA
jgi:hypothetical protein